LTRPHGITADNGQMGMKGSLGNLVQQARKMQEDLERAQSEIANAEVIGESGGGLVKIVMTGRFDAKKVSIDPAVPVDDRAMLEDLVAAAINDAARKVEAMSKERLAGMTADLGLPAGIKLF
jgi:DNA-binding YbaB/EbfC family protein